MVISKQFPAPQSALDVYSILCHKHGMEWAFLQSKQRWIGPTWASYNRKQETLTRCWCNVGSTSQTVVRQYTDIGSLSRAYWICVGNEHQTIVSWLLGPPGWSFRGIRTRMCSVTVPVLSACLTWLHRAYSRLPRLWVITKYLLLNMY